MKLLFLDFDGVLNSQSYMNKFIKENPDKQGRLFDQLDPKKLEYLNEIVEKTDTDIVISSTWRILYTFEQLKEILVSFGFKYPGRVVDKTPKSWSGYRGREIGQWLDEKFPGVKDINFVILDDDSDMEPYMDHLIKSTWRDGLTRKLVNKAIGRLNESDR